MTFVLLATGILLLLVGGALLIRGASGIAKSLGISPIVIGLTIVAFGTSSPELVVNIIGALRDETALAFGNVAGSNIANLGLVLGSAAIITPIAVESQLVRRELPFLLLATAVLVVLALDVPLRGEPARLDRADGIVLFLLFTVFVYITVREVLRQRSKDPLLTPMTTVQALATAPKLRIELACTVIGLSVLGLGGNLTITYGAELAHTWGVSEVVVGMLVIAIGTSLPELVTSIIAAIKREPDLAVGNVIGSNIFNSLVVLPATAVVKPIAIPESGAMDLLVSFLLAAVIIPVFFFGNAHLGRRTGSLLLVSYVGYLTMRTTGWL